MFSISTKEHIKYNMTEATPHFWKRHVFRNKNATLRPLIAEQDNWEQKAIGHSSTRRRTGGGMAEKADNQV